MPAVEAMKTMRPHFFAAHAVERRLHRKERAGEVDVERVGPKLCGNFFRGRALGAAGIGDDDVEFSARGLGGVIELRERFLVGHVGRFGMNIFVPRRRFIELLPAPPANRDGCACFRQRQRDGGADAAAAAGDECVFAAEAHGHTAVGTGSALPEIR